VRAGPPYGHIDHSVEHSRTFTERGISVAGGKQPGYALEFAAGPHTWTFECTSRDGGRITAWKLNGRNVLAEAKNLRLPHGSTFWPSPQRDWRWPPPEALDSRPYLVAFDPPNASITMDSVRDEALGLQLTKRYSIAPALLAIRIDYSMLNTGQKPRGVAPWEVTRIPPGGTTFFRSASTRADSGPFDALPVARSSGATAAGSAQAL
jgi:hypothetical protein